MIFNRIESKYENWKSCKNIIAVNQQQMKQKIGKKTILLFSVRSFFFQITLCNNSNYHELLTLCSISKLFEKKFPFFRLFFNYLIVDFHSNTHFRFSLKPEYRKWKNNEYYSWVYYQLECSRMHFIQKKTNRREKMRYSLWIECFYTWYSEIRKLLLNGLCIILLKA